MRGKVIGKGWSVGEEMGLELGLKASVEFRESESRGGATLQVGRGKSEAKGSHSSC